MALSLLPVMPISFPFIGNMMSHRCLSDLATSVQCVGFLFPLVGLSFPLRGFSYTHCLFENDPNSDSRAKYGKQKQCWPTMWSCWSSLQSIWKSLQKDQMCPKMWLYSCAFLEVSMLPLLLGFCPMDISSIDHRINEGKSIIPRVWFLKVSW